MGSERNGVPSVHIYQLQPAFTGLGFHIASNGNECASPHELENFVRGAQGTRQRSVDGTVEGGNEV